MTIHEYLKFLDQAGHKHIKYGEDNFIEYKKFFLENIPPHREVNISKWHILMLFLKGFAAIRVTKGGKKTHTVFEYVVRS